MKTNTTDRVKISLPETRGDVRPKMGRPAYAPKSVSQQGNNAGGRIQSMIRDIKKAFER